MAGPGQGMPMQMGGPTGGQMPGMHLQQVQPGSMNMPLGPPQGNTQHPQHPGQAQVQHQHAPMQDPRPFDHITRFKSLVPRLKESLATLFKTGGNLFYVNAQQDETGVQMDNISGRFEKSLEEFYAICDQVEMSLRLAYEIMQQDRASQRNTPVQALPPPGVAGGKTGDGQQMEGQSYSQYLTTVRAQIGCAKEIRDLLHDCLNNPHDHTHS